MQGDVNYWETNSRILYCVIQKNHDIHVDTHEHHPNPFLLHERTVLNSCIEKCAEKLKLQYEGRAA